MLWLIGLYLPLLIISFVGSFILLSAALEFRGRLRMASVKECESEYSPKATVIAPCKGLEMDFERNLLALLEQDYPGYVVIFVTQDQDDEAYPHLARFVSRFPHRARLITAGSTSQRSQKVHNQLAALQLADVSTEVYVFVDSDGCLNPHFLKRLVAPLVDPVVGVSTGYRWFVPTRRRASEILTVLWASVENALILADPQFTLPWGGAMAIRRQVFEDLNMIQVWSSASTDDNALGWAVRGEGLRIAFVPQAVVPSMEDYSLRQFVDFGARQLLLLRVYFPEMWWQLLALTTVSALTPITGLVLTVLGLLVKPTMLAIGLVLLTFTLGPVLSTAIVARSTERLLVELGQPVEHLAWWDFLLANPCAIIILIQFIQSGWTRRVEWRGVTYEFLAPDRTVVTTQRMENP